MPVVPIARIARAARAAASSAADLFWPPRCGGCDLPGMLVCDSCRAALSLIRPLDACPRCGAPEGTHGCAQCGRLEIEFAGARCAGVFEWPLSRLITMHKDAGELRLTAVLAGLAAEAAGDWCDWAQAVIPVPASPGARARRGFDHGGLLAAEFSHVTGVPALDALRATPRRDQRHLSRERRAANARASLGVHAHARPPARVLVLDDVLTTGATMNAAASALRDAGACEVRVVAVARACGGRV